MVVLDERASDVALTAHSTQGGLRDGWIALDGQKKALASFDGKSEAELDVPIASGEHDLVGKVETDHGHRDHRRAPPHKRLSWRGAPSASSKLWPSCARIASAIGRSTRST